MRQPADRVQTQARASISRRRILSPVSDNWIFRAKKQLTLTTGARRRKPVWARRGEEIKHIDELR